MLEREHQCTAMQELSSLMKQSAKQDSVSAQLCVSSIDRKETEMSFARDVHVDACFVQLASATIVASGFGGLIYKMLISRPELAAAVSVFAASLVSHLDWQSASGRFAGLVQIPTRGMQWFVRQCMDLH